MKTNIIMSVSLLFDDGHESAPRYPDRIDFYNGLFDIDVPLFEVSKGSTVVGGVIRSGPWSVTTKVQPETFKWDGTYKLVSLTMEVPVNGVK